MTKTYRHVRTGSEVELVGVVGRCAVFRRAKDDEVIRVRLDIFVRNYARVVTDSPHDPILSILRQRPN